MRFPQTKQELFLSMPPGLRQVAIVGVSAYHRLLRYGEAYRYTLSLAETADYWSDQQARAHQRTQLLRLLREAKDNTVHYGRVLADFSPARLEEAAAGLDLSALPLLEKSTLRQSTNEFFSRARRTVTRSSTSGSTGSPLVVEYDRESIEMRMAFVHHHRRWLGLRPMARSLRMSGRELVPSDRRRPPYWLLNPFENQLLVSTYHLREETMDSITERVAAFGPETIEGYPTAIAQFARFVQQRGKPISTLRGAITTAETLDPELRQVIRDGLGVPVLDYYAASEGVPLIQECPMGRYHLRVDSGMFEVLGPDGRAAGPGEVGELVATSFAQWKTPLLRYRTGDMAEVSESKDPCQCGRTLPYLESILGRVEDLVETPDGRRIGMFSYRTLKHVPGMTEAQILQKDYDAFDVRVVYDGTRTSSEVEAGINHVFARVLGYEPRVRLEPVGSIPRGPNGKFRSTIGLTRARASERTE